MTQNFAATSVLFLWIWGEFHLQLGAMLLKSVNAFLVSQEELFHVSTWSNLQGRAANGILFALPSSPQFPIPPSLSCARLCCSTLGSLGLTPWEKSPLTWCPKAHICLLKCLSGQYSASVESQPGFSCKLLALCSIASSWQQIYCSLEHPVRQHLNPDFSGIRGQNSPLDKNISPWWLPEAQRGLHRPFFSCSPDFPPTFIFQLNHIQLLPTLWGFHMF